MRAALISLFALTLALSVAAQFIFDAYAHQSEAWWQQVPAFFAIFGFVGCVLITVVAKALGVWWLQRKEDYYD